MTQTAPQAAAEAGALPERLLAFLAAELAAPGLAYAARPTPMTGGYDTRIFEFQLSGAPDPFAAPLVLRLLGERDDPARMLREKAWHDAVTAGGYPAPRALLTSTDVSILGGAFMIMERVAGRPLPEARPFNIGATLAEAQARLHALPVPESLASFQDGAMTLAGYIARLTATIDADLPSLRPAMAWVAEHVLLGGERVICHGDFHPYNILWGDDGVSVLDWPNAFLGPAVADVAATKVIVSYATISGSGPLMRVFSLLRPLLVRRYLGTYKKLSGRDLAGIEPFEALACMRALVVEGQGRLQPGVAPRPFEFERIIARFNAITGITPELPEAGA
ncbi:MAG: phosphotransferase [Dehalococcoidia bacterium]